MKKTLALILALVMIFALAACGSAAPAQPAASTATAAPETEAQTQTEAEPAADTSGVITAPVDLIYASQGAGTSNYTHVAAKIKVLTKYLPAGSNITQETISSGCSSVGYLIEAGLADLGDGENAAAATVGLEGRGPYTEINALFGTKTLDFVMMITSKKFYDKTGYSSIREVLENHYPAVLCCEDVGSSDYTCMSYTFEILGYTFEEFESWGGRIVTTSGDTCAEMLKDNQADMMIAHTSDDSSTMTELAMTTDVIMTSIDEEIIQGFIDRGFGAAKIPAGCFDRFDEDTPSAAIGASFIVSSEMDDDLAYTLTKIFVEHKDELAEELWEFGDLSYKEMVDTTTTVVPLHPGAIRYFQEIGVLDTDGNYIGE